MTTPGWWFLLDVPDRGTVAACAPAKCGLTSLQIGMVPGLAEIVERFGSVDAGRAAFAFARTAGLGPFSAQEIVSRFPNLPRYLSVRDPLERFVSLWKDKGDPALAEHPVFWQTAGLSFPELVDFVESYPFGNDHWSPQHAYLIPRAKLVPFKLFNVTLGLPEVHANASKRGNPPEDVAEYRDRIRRLYARDFELWEEANR